MLYRPLECVTENHFSYFSTKSYVVGTRWDSSFEHPKHMFKLMDKKKNRNFTLNTFCLTGPMFYITCILTQWSCKPKKQNSMTRTRNYHNQRRESKWVWSENTTVTNCRPTNGAAMKSQITLTVTKHQEGNQSKSTSSLFPVKFFHPEICCC